MHVTKPTEVCENEGISDSGDAILLKESLNMHHRTVWAKKENPAKPPVIEFHCNRPFLYAITEVSSGAIYFIGQYTGE